MEDVFIKKCTIIQFCICQRQGHPLTSNFCLCLFSFQYPAVARSGMIRGSQRNSIAAQNKELLFPSVQCSVHSIEFRMLFENENLNNCVLFYLLLFVLILLFHSHKHTLFKYYNGEIVK